MAVSSLITLTLSLLPAKAKADQQAGYQPMGPGSIAPNGDLSDMSEEDQMLYEQMMQNIDPNNTSFSGDDGMRHGV